MHNQRTVWSSVVRDIMSGKPYYNMTNAIAVMPLDELKAFAIRAVRFEAALHVNRSEMVVSTSIPMDRRDIKRVLLLPGAQHLLAVRRNGNLCLHSAKSGEAIAELPWPSPEPCKRLLQSAVTRAGFVYISFSGSWRT
jgi:hypothetical protein